MCEIKIPKKLVENIENLIKDDAIKREYGYESVNAFVIYAIETEIKADKDSVGIPI